MIAYKHPQAKIEMIGSSGGVFEINFNGQLIFSKKQTGRFPTHDEILKVLES
ncbi:MAG: SelT/SelW/SelH family protein [Deferribacteres bacterium]|nr:Rdx family protein [candidate division KSB1 bacterium]MCB9510538.1 SelT/SelW/SelH family protein [Deferribacteres bacterium]